MSLLKKLLTIFCAFAVMLASHEVFVLASSEREVIEDLLYVRNSRLVLKDYNALAIAKEDTKIYNDKGMIIGTLKKDAAANIVNLLNDEVKYEIVSGEVRGFVETEKLLVGKLAELRAVAILEEKAAANSKKLTFEKKEFIYDKQKESVSFEITMDGILDSAEPAAIELEEKEEVVLSVPVKEESQQKEESKKEEKDKKDSSKRKVKYSGSDLDLLAAIVYCEAGNQSFQGKLAVANVILNRVESKKFPNSIKGVVYARRQFSPARNGRLKRALKNGVPKSCYEASRSALGGNNNVEGYFYFDGSIHQGGYKKIDSHYFWRKPW